MEKDQPTQVITFGVGPQELLPDKLCDGLHVGESRPIVFFKSIIFFQLISCE
jgi:hypothetical protein